MSTIAVDLVQDVENRMMELINNREAFTTVDVSKPLVESGKAKGHRQVRSIVDDLIMNGTLANNMYVTSQVTVYPTSGGSQNVRLFHPDDVDFDPSDYTKTRQVINRTSGSVTTRGFDSDVIDSITANGGDALHSIVNTSTGGSVSRSCRIQTVRNTLNVPRLLIVSAGFNPNDPIEIENETHSIKIKKGSSDSKQTVDKEGRIRLHGDNVATLIAFSKNSQFTAMHVNDTNGSYIQIQ